MKFILKIIFIYLIIVLPLFATDINLTKEEENWLKSQDKINLYTSLGFEKFFFLDDKKTPSGAIVDFIEIISKKIGKDIKIKNFEAGGYSSERLFKLDDSYGYLPLFNSAKNKKIFNLTTPFVYTSLRVFISKQSKGKINSLNDLRGKKLAILEPLTKVDFLSGYEDIKIVKVKTPIEQLDLLQFGEVDAILGYRTHNRTIVENSYSNVTHGFNINNSLPLTIGINKEYPLLHSVLNKTLKTISQKEILSIMEKWIISDDIQSKKIEKKYLINLTPEEKKYLQENHNLKVQGLATFPPFNFTNNNTPSGYSIDYIKLVGKYLGANVEFTNAKSFGETITMFKEGKIDILPHIARNKKRESYIEYTNFDHIKYFIGITIRKNENIASMEDLKDKIISVVNKSFIHTFLMKNYPAQKLLSLPSTSDAVEAVSSGKADALIGSIPTMNFYIQKNWLSNVYTTKINIAGLPNEISMPMGVQKGNNILKSILEKVNLKIPHNEIIKLKQKWMNIEENEENSFNQEELLYLKEKNEIKMCVLPDWLPFEQIDENGKHKGIGSDILKILSKKIEKEFILVPTNQWSDSLQNLRDRKCDILPVAMDIPSRRDKMNFTKAYVSEPFVLATKSDQFFIKDEKELSGKKIGIVASYAFIEVMKSKNPKIKIVEVKNTKEGLEKVSSGELFAYLDTMPTVGYFIQKYGLLDLKIAGKLDYDIKLSIASRNDEPLLNNILQKALNEISDDEIRKIVGKWIEIKVQQEFDYQKLIYMAIVFMLIILVITYKNRSIKKINKQLALANHEVLEQQFMVDKYVMILSTDLDGKIIEVNDAYCNKIGFQREELISNDHSIIRHPDMKEEFFIDLWKTISLNKVWNGEIRNLTKNKETVYFYVIIEPLLKNGKKIGYRSISEDITDKKRIEELSITDRLTGIYNRLKIDELLIKQENLFERYSTPFSIILVDIDDFKSINDSFGHDVGDYALMEVTKILKESIRKTDEVGRWGGEEFIIICTNVGIEGAHSVSENIRKNVEKKKFSKIGKITISAGVSTFIKSDNIDSLFQRVDIALYKAKRNGKNQTVLNDA